MQEARPRPGIIPRQSLSPCPNPPYSDQYALRALRAAVLAAAVFLGSCTSEVGTGSATVTKYIPLASLPAKGTRLMAADLAIDRHRTLHCVSYVSHGPEGSPRGANLYYHRGVLNGED